jgi:hypothetical protein
VLRRVSCLLLAAVCAVLGGCYVAVGVDGVLSGAIDITDHPESQTVRVGETATFAVTVVGTGSMRFQWLRDGVAIPGATSAGYRTPPTVLADSGSVFSVRVCNEGLCVRSDDALLTVVP